MSCGNNLKQPLSCLADESPQISTCKTNRKSGMMAGGALSYIIWFIVIAIIVWVILIVTRPTWVQVYSPEGQPTGVVDQGKAITWSVVIALIIVIIIWVIRLATKKREAPDYEF